MQPHCLFLTETWLTPNCTDAHLKELTPVGYELMHRCRHDSGSVSGGRVRRGGGVGCLVDERFDSKIVPTPKYSAFEHFLVKIDFGKIQFNIVTIYRPPNLSISQFFEQFQDLLSNLITLQSSFIITGDFNIHVDDVLKTNIQTFNAVLDTFNLKQHVNFATHIKGHTLDLFITPEECKYKIKIESTEILSDHFSVTATIDFVIPILPPKTITYRAVNKINLAQFKNDLAKSDLLTSTCSNASSLYQLYHSTLSSLLNKHAPLKTKTCYLRPKEPWMSEDILIAKRKKTPASKELGDVSKSKIYLPRPNSPGSSFQSYFVSGQERLVHQFN